MGYDRIFKKAEKPRNLNKILILKGPKYLYYICNYLKLHLLYLAKFIG